MLRAVDKQTEGSAPPIFIFALHALLQPEARRLFLSHRLVFCCLAIYYASIFAISPKLNPLSLSCICFSLLGREGTRAKAMPYPSLNGLGL